MRGFKSVLAATLAAAMVFGSVLTVCADASEGSATGAGTSEGHVDKKLINVVLPTIAEGSTPFAYTMDPEGLVKETTHAKYGESVIFPTSDDSQVYFNNGKKGGDGTDKDYIVYANTSAKQTVTNKSSQEVELTVTVAASTAATDIPLVTKAALSGAENASLYLGLKVDEEAAVAVSTETVATQTVTIEGTPANFKIAVKSDNSGYEYRELTLAEYKELVEDDTKTQADFDATWATSEFQLEGAVTTDKEITSTTTAPTLTVTWSWVDPEAEAEAAAAAAEAAAAEAAAAAETFKTTYAEVLALTAETAEGTEEEAAAIAAAAEAFEALDDAVKTILAEDSIDAELFETLAGYNEANAAPTVSAESIVAGGEGVEIHLPAGVTISEIQKKKSDGTYNTLPTDLYTLEDIDGGKKLTVKASIKTQFAAATSIKIVFSSGDPITLDVE